jgi:hypothetical protein
MSNRKRRENELGWKQLHEMMSAIKKQLCYNARKISAIYIKYLKFYKEDKSILNQQINL